MGHPTDIFSPGPSTGFICAICHDVLKDASTFRECGHTFCDDCITDCLGHNNSCPNCRVVVTGSNPNYALREIVESLPVNCPEWCNSKKRKRDEEDDDQDVAAIAGCDWKGQLKDLKDHEKVCDFKIVACNVNGCEHRCKRKDMASHHSSPTGMMMHQELRHENNMKSMELRYESKMKFIELKHENDIKEMGLRYENNIEAVQLALTLREQMYEKKLEDRDQKYEKKLREEMKELEAGIYTRLGVTGSNSPLKGDESEAKEQESSAGYGGGRALNDAVLQYIKNEG